MRYEEDNTALNMPPCEARSDGGASPFLFLESLRAEASSGQMGAVQAVMMTQSSWPEHVQRIFMSVA
jgi:hypothetical protein